jgi:hypothetical protein
MRRILAISSIGNQPHNLHGKYIPGSGVGASSVATRRLKLQKAAPCYDSTPQIQYLRVSDIATLVGNEWMLNGNTVITPYQYLIIYNSGTPQNPGPDPEDLHIPAGMTFTNNGQVDNYGSIHTEFIGNTGAIVYNTGTFRNYGTIQVNGYCGFYTYGGGSIFNNTATNPAPQGNIVLLGSSPDIGIFALPPISGSGCGTGTFTGKAISYSGVVTYVCPP